MEKWTTQENNVQKKIVVRETSQMVAKPGLMPSVSWD